MPDAEENQKDLELLIELGREAGAIAMQWFGKDPEVWMKEGDSPVCQADFAVDNFLKEKLLAARSDYGWLSEETDDNEERLSARRTFVVDPIDGTRGFINGLDQWCISIAVVEDGRPVVGILECPALQQTIVATAESQAVCNNEVISAADIASNAPIRVTGPRSYQTAVQKGLSRTVEKLPFVPSLAYRLAMVAMGQVDLSLARGSAKDWDLAAADLIIHKAAARLSGMDGELLRYNCRDIRHGSLVASASKHHDEMLDLARQAMNKPHTK